MTAIFSYQYEPGECVLTLGGTRGQSVPILDWVFANEHIGLWKFLGEKKWSSKKKKFIEPKEMWNMFFTFLFFLVSIYILNKIKVI